MNVNCAGLFQPRQWLGSNPAHVVPGVLSLREPYQPGALDTGQQRGQHLRPVGVARETAGNALQDELLRALTATKPCSTVVALRA